MKNDFIDKMLAKLKEYKTSAESSAIAYSLKENESQFLYYRGMEQALFDVIDYINRERPDKEDVGIEVFKRFYCQPLQSWCGVYYYNNTLIIQNGGEYKAVPFYCEKSIKDCVSSLTPKAIELIKEALEKYDSKEESE